MGLYDVQLRECYQKLAGAFAQLADLLAELFGGLDDLMPDIGLTREPQVIFVPSLNHQGRNDRKNHQEQKAAGQSDLHPAPADEPAHCRSFYRGAAGAGTRLLSRGNQARSIVGGPR